MISRRRFFQSKFSIIAIIAVTLLGLLGLTTLVLSQSREDLDWKPANSVAPAALVSTALQQNYLENQSKTPLYKNQIKVLKIHSRGAGNVYIFDFNTPQLCGSAGCLYAVYTEDGKSVLSLLLNTQLPQKVLLFSVSEQTRNGFPCLEIAQPTKEQSMISQSQYCYEGTGFVLVNSSVISGGA